MLTFFHTERLFCQSIFKICVNLMKDLNFECPLKSNPWLNCAGSYVINLKIKSDSSCENCVKIRKKVVPRFVFVQVIQKSLKRKLILIAKLNIVDFKAKEIAEIGILRDRNRVFLNLGVNLEYFHLKFKFMLRKVEVMLGQCKYWSKC